PAIVNGTRSVIPHITPQRCHFHAKQRVDKAPALSEGDEKAYCTSCKERLDFMLKCAGINMFSLYMSLVLLEPRQNFGVEAMRHWELSWSTMLDDLGELHAGQCPFEILLNQRKISTTCSISNSAEFIFARLRVFLDLKRCTSIVGDDGIQTRIDGSARACLDDLLPAQQAKARARLADAESRGAVSTKSQPAADSAECVGLHFHHDHYSLSDASLMKLKKILDIKPQSVSEMIPYLILKPDDSYHGFKSLRRHGMLDLYRHVSGVLNALPDILSRFRDQLDRQAERLIKPSIAIGYALTAPGSSPFPDSFRVSHLPPNCDQVATLALFQRSDETTYQGIQIMDIMKVIDKDKLSKITLDHSSLDLPKIAERKIRSWLYHSMWPVQHPSTKTTAMDGGQALLYVLPSSRTLSSDDINVSNHAWMLYKKLMVLL
ncbi:hypothetical protein FOL47_001939, partial [Perkinsus chesapeaki]